MLQKKVTANSILLLNVFGKLSYKWPEHDMLMEQF